MWIEDKLGEDCERRTMLGQWHQLVIGVSELAIRGVLCEWMHQTIRPWLAYYLIFVFAHMTIGALLALFANNPLPRFGLEIPPPKGFFPVPFGHGLSGGEYEAQGEKNVTIKPMCWHERYEWEWSIYLWLWGSHENLISWGGAPEIMCDLSMRSCVIFR